MGLDNVVWLMNIPIRSLARMHGDVRASVRVGRSLKRVGRFKIQHLRTEVRELF